MLFFDGDRSALSLKEMLLMENGSLLTGQQLRSDTDVLWENRFPVGYRLPTATPAGEA